MSDGGPFDDLDEALGEQDTPSDDAASDTGEETESIGDSTGRPGDNDKETTTDRSTADREETATTDTDSTSPSTDPLSESSGDVSTDPAFEFGVTKQGAFYARENTWRELQDTFDFALERRLRDRGIRETTKAEKYDAMMRVATDHVEEIADAIVAARRDAHED